MHGSDINTPIEQCLALLATNKIIGSACKLCNRHGILLWINLPERAMATVECGTYCEFHCLTLIETSIILGLRQKSVKDILVIAL